MLSCLVVEPLPGAVRSNHVFSYLPWRQSLWRAQLPCRRLMAALAYAKDPKYHGRTKHKDIKFNFIREIVTQKQARLAHSYEQSFFALDGARKNETCAKVAMVDQDEVMLLDRPRIEICIFHDVPIDDGQMRDLILSLV
ncbi:hypothetical protein CsSME_00017446 [Camellia sinensis var. sinensis]